MFFHTNKWYVDTCHNTEKGKGGEGKGEEEDDIDLKEEEEENVGRLTWPGNGQVGQ